MTEYRWRGPKPVITDEQPDNPYGLPPVRWWWVGPRGDQRYRQLRGWPAFQLARECGVDVFDWDDIQPDNTGPDGTKVKIGPKDHRHRFWVGNPATEGMVRMFRDSFRRWPAYRRLRLVVDVTFNVAELEALIGVGDPSDPLFTHDMEVMQDYWARHLPNLLEMVRLADAVTTVHPEWASPLTLLSDHVTVLPDLVEESQIPAFLAVVAELFGDQELIK